jgi:hypothetical protein
VVFEGEATMVGTLNGRLSSKLISFFSGLITLNDSVGDDSDVDAVALVLTVRDGILLSTSCIAWSILWILSGERAAWRGVHVSSD